MEISEGEENVVAFISPDDFGRAPFVPDQERSGVLSPGRYAFRFDGAIDNFETGGSGGGGSIGYATGLRLESTPPVIPLPPALWAGLMMLGALAGGGQIKRLRTRPE